MESCQKLKDEGGCHEGGILEKCLKTCGVCKTEMGEPVCICHPKL